MPSNVASAASAPASAWAMRARATLMFGKLNDSSGPTLKRKLELLNMSLGASAVEPIEPPIEMFG